ncbi:MULTISPECIES: S8 family serine peptidase [Rhodanobacter]|uniref:S8 family serine peptidase n=1 Tax=Rhodanobacter TaxID=75309 RepID=UPI0003FC032D|nr:MULTISPECIES: S8 family serine peptidase [Rhodanobacter]KZC20816.1 serine protease [Rhodanobacter denitrificans]UJJ51729.1 S8 family serine peptidase [Rhodanobacter denitrificans]UJM94473.1 S8 family serine peptidase [Rhodanobacter denitrificans]UJM98003.1 S8 family serine peptidase [Rhodanobacter denitrificans]UJN22583.1 S8 family serine peptidase [Rhodanobacter denitrificans]
MKHGAIVFAAAMVLSACAHLRPAAPADDPADPHRSSVASASAMDSRRDIVLAVANPLAPPATHAGSSVLGYVPSANYGVGQRAASTLAVLKRTYGWQEVTGWPVKALDLYCIVLTPAPGMPRAALLKALAADARVRLAQPLQDYSVYADPPRQGAHHYNDPYADLQRGFVETDAALAHDLSQGAEVDVAIVDTGVDLTHPDLRGRIRDTRNLVDADRAAFDRDNHGTEVAGVIAADADNHQGIVGMAPKARLSIYKACWYPPSPGAGARCNTFTLAKALAAIIDTDTRIINLSLGGPADPLLDQLLARLLEQGRIVITALPPDGNAAGFPDRAPGVIVVRSSNASRAPPGVLSAPGSDILTTQPDGGYDFTSGSSMAAAHVSGIAALLLAMAPGLDARSMHDLLLQSSRLSDGTLQVNAASAVARLRDEEKAAP